MKTKMILGTLVSLSTAMAGRAYAAEYPERSVTVFVTGEDVGKCKLELCELPNNRRLALTTSWDDGSNPEWDLRMARLLRENGWKGTFFWPLWANAISQTETILETGMEIGTHSTTHPHMTTKSPDSMFWELAASCVFLG
ncbi:polysaccharide deacetylase family protein, partial [Candidatus Hydrogenedentota bacterium]